MMMILQFVRIIISILISRVLFENVKYFNLTFDGVIKWHIGHDYWEEMSFKSVVVSAPRYIAIDFIMQLNYVIIMHLLSH